MSQNKKEFGLNQDAQVPLIKCIYHKDQIVTNFCSSPECMHPLCPVCINQHVQDHKHYSDYAHFDLYEDVLKKSNDEINVFLKTLKGHKDKIENLDDYKQKSEYLKRQINVAHNKAKVLLDDYFRAIEAELDASLNQQSNQYKEKRHKIYEQLQSRAEVNVNYALGLYNHEKSVRSLLTYLHNNVADQNKKFLTQLENVEHEKSLDVCTDSSKLHEIHVLLSKFVKIESSPIEQFQNPEEHGHQSSVASSHFQSINNSSAAVQPTFQQGAAPIQQAPPVAQAAPSMVQATPSIVKPMQQQPRVMQNSMPPVVYDYPPVQPGYVGNNQPLYTSGSALPPHPQHHHQHHHQPPRYVSPVKGHNLPHQSHYLSPHADIPPYTPI